MLVNNLGNATGVEVNIVLRKVMLLLAEANLKVARVMSGHFMTALDMAGVSLSILPLDTITKARLDAPTTANAWPRAIAAPRSDK